jgi:hypothetical protein
VNIGISSGRASAENDGRTTIASKHESKRLILQQFADNHTFAFVGVWLASFALLWVAVCFLIGRLSGWQALAERYRFDGDFTGTRWRFRSGRMRWTMHYGNILTLGADSSGVYLSVFRLFRAGHPPLLVPWREIAVTERRFFFVRWTGLILGRKTKIPLWLSMRLGAQILNHRPADYMTTIPLERYAD